MKKLLFLFILFISCKKDTDKENTTAVKVSDSITGSPVSGASFVLFNCGSLGCAVSYKTVFSGTTDNNGIVNVSSPAYQDVSNELNVTKSDYLPFEVQRNTTLLLRPKGWLRMRIMKTGNYPAGSRLGISNEFNPYSLLVNAAVDSIIVMSGGGGVINKVWWQVINESGQQLKQGSGTVQVPRLDTTNVIINY